MQHELHPRPGVFQVHEQVPCLLNYPRLDRMLGDARDPDLAGAVLDHGKDVRFRAIEQVSGEEVQRQDPLCLGPEELRPARAVAAWRRCDSGALEYLPHRRRRHRDA
ncbi:MAG: hypothetical protein ACRDRJ_41215, partial [Streptosporangiaceae bacterium]